MKKLLKDGVLFKLLEKADSDMADAAAPAPGRTEGGADGRAAAANKRGRVRNWSTRLLHSRFTGRTSRRSNGRV